MFENLSNDAVFAVTRFVGWIVLDLLLYGGNSLLSRRKRRDVDCDVVRRDVDCDVVKRDANDMDDDLGTFFNEGKLRFVFILMKDLMYDTYAREHSPQWDDNCMASLQFNMIGFDQIQNMCL